MTVKEAVTKVNMRTVREASLATPVGIRAAEGLERVAERSEIQSISK